jgi:hypothetical protein
MALEIEFRLLRWLLKPVAFCGERVWSQITFCLAVVPLLVAANFYCYVLRARMDLGHWPVFNDRYPKIFHKQMEHAVTDFSLLPAPFTFLLVGLFAVLGGSCYPNFPVWKLAGLGLATSVFLAILWSTDPGGYFNWFFD